MNNVAWVILNNGIRESVYEMPFLILGRPLSDRFVIEIARNILSILVIKD